MDQPSHAGSPHQGFDVSSTSVAQMMEENREGLGMKVIAVIVQRYGAFPKELWDLNSISDMGAGRGITYDVDMSRATFKAITSNTRYSIVNLTICKHVSRKIELPNTLRRLEVLVQTYKWPLDLPQDLQELFFDRGCTYNLPLALPANLRRLVLGDAFSQPLTFPLELLELELGSGYSYHLNLPPRLKRLVFAWSSPFNFPLALPASLVCVRLNDEYNQPTLLPNGIEEVRVGSAFGHDLSLPDCLQKIVWCRDRPIQISENLIEIGLGTNFNQPVTLPAQLRKVTFANHLYTHPVNLPVALQDLTWYPGHHEDLSLPEDLQKLTWASPRSVRLPSGLKELVLAAEAKPRLIFPTGLLKVTFDCTCVPPYDLPESVAEVIMATYTTFFYPGTLQHLILRGSYDGYLDLSHHRVHRLTIDDCGVKISDWPRELKEVEFTVGNIGYPLQVPKGCKIVGDKRPRRIVME